MCAPGGTTCHISDFTAVLIFQVTVCAKRYFSRTIRESCIFTYIVLKIKSKIYTNNELTRMSYTVIDSVLYLIYIGFSRKTWDLIYQISDLTSVRDRHP